MSLPMIVAPIFFSNDTATTEIYTLSLHDALPISNGDNWLHVVTIVEDPRYLTQPFYTSTSFRKERSEEHTSELQSLAYLVCRLLLEKKKNTLASTPRYPTSLVRCCSRPPIRAIRY